MSDRDAGFLWENERAYITGETDDRRIKAQLKNNSATTTTVGTALRTVRSDLELVEEFWRARMSEEGGRYEWEDIILPANEDEIRRLRDLLDDWLDHAQTDFVEREDELLEEHLEPLWRDLELGEKARIRHGRLFLESPDAIGEQWSEDLNEEVVARLESLIALLRQSGLREVLLWIDENPNRKISKERKYGEQSWRWAASRRLETDYGLLVGRHNHVYELTRRGEAVRETLQTLAESEVDAVANLDTDAKLRKWASFLERRSSSVE